MTILHDYCWSYVLEVLEIPSRAAAGLEVYFFGVDQKLSLTKCRVLFKKNIFMPSLYSVPYFTKIFLSEYVYRSSFNCMWIHPVIWLNSCLNFPAYFYFYLNMVTWVTLAHYEVCSWFYFILFFKSEQTLKILLLISRSFHLHSLRTNLLILIQSQ